MTTTRTGCIAACVLFFAALTLRTADTTGFEIYGDWLSWARCPDFAVIGLADSYDRDGGNYDFSQYDSPSGLIRDESVCTVRELAGPGLIHRFWMPHLTSHRDFVIRMYFDGEETPRIDTTSNVWLHANYSYFDEPLVNTLAGGQTSYWPIAFESSLRIETINKALPEDDDEWSANRHYYQYNYSLLDAADSVRTFDGTLTEDEQSQADTVAALFASPGEHPAGDDESAAHVETGAQTINPGETLNVADVAGPGIARRICVKLADVTDAVVANLHLRVTYDSDASAAIDVAVGDFFGAGRERAAYKSLPVGTDSADGFYLFWPVPFRGNIKVELHNAGDTDAISIDNALVEYISQPIDGRIGYLRASVNETVKESETTLHTLLHTTGPGVYIGNLLFVEQGDYSFEMLEGDDIIAIDGGSTTLYGTGLEDAYNAGYYFNWVGKQYDEPEPPMSHSATRPLSGVLFIDRTFPNHARADAYRWLIADRVPFEKSINVDIECRYGVTGGVWRSVAYWYEIRPTPGDSNCDGVVDFDDIDCFVAALISEAEWDGCGRAAGCSYLGSNDVNHDEAVNFDDIDGFVDCLIDGC